MNVIKVSWRRSKTFTILTVLLFLIALFFISVAFILPSLELTIATIGLGIALALIALSDMGDVLDKQKIDQILTKLSELEDLQKEMQQEQKERQDSSPPIVASLQALSQYYADYLAKQKGEQSGEKS